MRRWLLMLLLALLCCHHGRAQSGCIIRGVLTDKMSRQTLPGVSVKYISLPSGKPESVETDFQGYFETLSIVQDYKFWLVYENRTDTLTLPPEACGSVVTYEIESILPVPLPSVEISSYQTIPAISAITASLAYRGKDFFDRTDNTSLQQTMNSIPGVIMESRGYGGSHKISIRGSALRSPFAVRNIKMYFEGIPLTSPDGQAPLEMIDQEEVTSVEVIKGPMGSVYGSGNGGVILFKGEKAEPGKISAGSTLQAGSFDLYRIGSYASIGFRNGGLRISHVYQDNAGYRKQEFNHKNQVNLLYQQVLSYKQKITVYGTYYEGNWGLPGALTATQAESDPRSAVNFSINNNAKLVRNRLFGGVSHTAILGYGFRQTTSLYSYATNKINPYGTSNFNSGYKDEGADGYGGRTDWTWTKQFEVIGLKIGTGGEWQSEKYNILESSILNSQPNEFKYFYDIGYTSSMAFLNSEIHFKKIVLLGLGASMNQLTQDVRGLNDNGFAFDTTAIVRSNLLPRVSAAFQMFSWLTIYGSHSSGISNPTAFEMVDYENNSFNLSLRPESGINNELGVRMGVPSWHLLGELAVYRFELKNAILAYPFPSSGEDAVIRYHNAGETRQNGIEWSVSYTYQPGHEWLETRFWTNGSAYYYTFGNYTVDGVRFNGRKLPGTPNFNTSSGLSFLAMQRLRLDIIHYWFDKTPLNNANSDWAAAYHLVNCKLACPFNFARNWLAEPYIGVNNLLSADFSSFYNVNAAGDKYYNPTPPVNFFAGVSVHFNRSVRTLD